MKQRETVKKIKNKELCFNVGPSVFKDRGILKFPSGNVLSVFKNGLAEGETG